jgi:hypothetical protein
MLDASRSQSLAAWCTLEKQLLAVGALDWAKTGEASASRSQSLAAWYVAEKQSLAVRWAGWMAACVVDASRSQSLAAWCAAEKQSPLVGPPVPGPTLSTCEKLFPCATAWGEQANKTSIAALRTQLRKRTLYISTSFSYP